MLALFGCVRSRRSRVAYFALVAAGLPAEKAQWPVSVRPQRLRKASRVLAEPPRSERWRRKVPKKEPPATFVPRFTHALGLTSPSRTSARTRFGNRLA